MQSHKRIRAIERRIVAIHCAAILAITVIGCGPRELLPSPSEMPTELGVRRLWNTPRAYIYARDESTAGETDRWIGSLAGHIRRTFDADLGKGLVIVIDDEETPCVDSVEQLFELQHSAARASGLIDDADLPTLDEYRERLRDSGMTDALACAMTPVVLDDTTLRTIGFSAGRPADVSWAVSCPSDRRMDSGIWEFAPTAIENKKGGAFAVATAWAWPLAFPEAAKGFRLARDSLVFEQWIATRRELTIGERIAAIEDYRSQRALRLGPTFALAWTMAKNQSAGEATEKSPTSQPVAPE